MDGLSTSKIARNIFCKSFEFETKVRDPFWEENSHTEALFKKVLKTPVIRYFSSRVAGLEHGN